MAKRISKKTSIKKWISGQNNKKAINNASSSYSTNQRGGIRLTTTN